MQLTKQIIEFNNQKIVCEFTIKKQNVVILHGAGASSRVRFYPFAQEILKHNYGVVLFDFIGHGNSTGNLRDSSLKERQEQAIKVIETLLPKSSRFILVGFSMSGETVCDLLPIFPERIKTILLGCPAIYTKEATSIQFKDDEFKTLIRTKESWKNSIALKKLAGFNGKTFITYGSQDEIIPREIIDTLRNTTKNSVYKQYNEVSHSLAIWLGDHPAHLSSLIDEIIQADSKAV